MKASELAKDAERIFKIPESLDEARKIQQEIAGKVKIKSFDLKGVCTAAALDVSYDHKTREACAAAVVFRLDSLEIVEVQTAKSSIVFPYVPGFLAFREIPPVLEALKKIDSKVQLFICEGHGLSHPRKAGLASHLGVLLDAPTFGIAKNLLFGKVEEKPFEFEKFECRFVLSPDSKEKLAVQMRMLQSKYKPVYASPGHRTDISSILKIYALISDRYRIPKPLREAHRFSRFYIEKI